VGVVLLGVVAGGSRPVESARVYSGPTDGVADLAVRVELGQRDKFMEAPLPDTGFTLEAIAGGQTVATARGRSDALGQAEVELRLLRPLSSAFELRVAPLGHGAPPLARGLVLGSKQVLARLATRRGGFQSGRHSGDIELAVAPARGALMPAQGALHDELVISARRAGSPVADAKLSIKLEGAEPAESKLVTDAAGLARLELQPSEASVRVAIDAAANPVGTGTLAARLDVVQGAIRVTRRGDSLIVESSGAAPLAYLGFFDEGRRYAGRRVELHPAPDGHLVGELPWPAGLTASPLWVVASSQPDLASPASVGWPVVGQDAVDPKTFDARELLLLDGAPLAQAREERRARRVRFVTAGYAMVALLLTLGLFVRRVREAETDIEEHLARAGLDDAEHAIAPVKRGRGVLAAACIGLGFLVLALFALLKDR
jgi:hypothetical protein